MDTNVLISALRSNRGASFRLLSLVGKASFALNLSVPLVLEYEDAAPGGRWKGKLRPTQIGDILDYLCKVGNHRSIHFLWRPTLRDPKDEMVLELALTSRAYAIVTYNKVDFSGAEAFGIRLLTPQEFLKKIGDLP